MKKGGGARNRSLKSNLVRYFSEISLGDHEFCRPRWRKMRKWKQRNDFPLFNLGDISFCILGSSDEETAIPNFDLFPKICQRRSQILDFK